MANVRKTVEEKVADIDAKIEKHNKQIQTLENQKKALLAPKPLTAKEILAMAKEKGLTEEDILKKLGLNK